MKDLKLFLSYKNKHKLLKNEVLIPIQTGRAIADQVFDEMLGDDTGDNISCENPYYCELTAQYWVWKNYDKVENPDYVGFMHYRRHFIFNEKYKHHKNDKMFKNGYSAYVFDDMNDEYFEKIGLDADTIQKCIADNDAIFVKKANAKFLKCKNGLEDFVKNCYSSNKEDYHTCMKIVERLFPEYKKEIKLLNKGPYRYFYNMFIMKKEIFFRYSEFLFTVLGEMKKELNCEYYSENAQRVLGYMGEFLLSLFAFKLHNEKKTKIKELYSSFVLNTQDVNEDLNIEPYFENNFTAIAMSSSNEYVPYLSVALQSLIENRAEDHNYDIIIFERSISAQNKLKLKKQIERDNVSLRFINPTFIIKNYKLKFPKCYNLECYFRLAAPVLLKKYKKFIFTDVDLIFKEDVQNLHKIELGDKPLAACQDLMFGAFLNIPKFDWKEYVSSVLKLENPYNYFNTGVLIFNNDIFNKLDYSYKLLSFVSKTQFRILEQDGLNAYFKDDIKYIPDTAWNYPVESSLYKDFLKYMPADFLKKYRNDKKFPKIIHWAGVKKPWYNTNEEYADIWWSYARKTPFYEECLMRMCQLKPDEITDLINYKKIVLKYWKYKLFCNFTYGKLNNKYYQKKVLCKQKINNVKDLIKNKK